MPTIAELLELRKGGAKPVTAFIGSGGKTSLLFLLAQRFREERVLVGTSVKLGRPDPESIDRFFLPEDASRLHGAEPGITLVGRVLEAEHKISAPPLELFGRLASLFDFCLIEADGSRRLPYKGWAHYEPVVPDCVGMTVAVMPVPPPDCLITEECVHRLPLFCEITGARPGDILRPEHLAAAVSHPRGLLAKARGRTALVFNQVESREAADTAREILSLLPPSCRVNLWRVFAASAHRDRGAVLAIR